MGVPGQRECAFAGGARGLPQPSGGKVQDCDDRLARQAIEWPDQFVDGDAALVLEHDGTGIRVPRKTQAPLTFPATLQVVRPASTALAFRPGALERGPMAAGNDHLAIDLHLNSTHLPRTILLSLLTCAAASPRHGQP